MTEPPQEGSTRKPSVTFRPSKAGLAHIDARSKELGVDRTALINAMLSVAARRPAEVLAQVRKTAMLEKRQEQR